MLTIYLIKNRVKQLYYKVIIQFKTTIFYFKIKNVICLCDVLLLLPMLKTVVLLSMFEGIVIHIFYF